MLDDVLAALDGRLRKGQRVRVRGVFGGVFGGVVAKDWPTEGVYFERVEVDVIEHELGCALRWNVHRAEITPVEDDA